MPNEGIGTSRSERKPVCSWSERASSSNISAFIQPQPPRYVEHLSVTECTAKTQTRGLSRLSATHPLILINIFSANRWVSTLAAWNVLSLMHFSLIHDVAARSCLFFSLLLAPRLRMLSWMVRFTQSVYLFFFFTFRCYQQHLIKHHQLRGCLLGSTWLLSPFWKCLILLKSFNNLSISCPADIQQCR